MIIYILMVFLCNLQSSLCPSSFINSAAAPAVLDQQVEKMMKQLLVVKGLQIMESCSCE